MGVFEFKNYKKIWRSIENVGSEVYILNLENMKKTCSLSLFTYYSILVFSSLQRMWPLALKKRSVLLMHIQAMHPGLTVCNNIQIIFNSS